MSIIVLRKSKQQIKTRLYMIIINTKQRDSLYFFFFFLWKKYELPFVGMSQKADLQLQLYKKKKKSRNRHSFLSVVFFFMSPTSHPQLLPPMLVHEWIMNYLHKKMLLAPCAFEKRKRRWKWQEIGSIRFLKVNLTNAEKENGPHLKV